MRGCVVKFSLFLFLFGCHVVLFYSAVDIVVMSGDVFYCSEVSDTLVGVTVFSIIWSELLIISEIN